MLVVATSRVAADEILPTIASPFDDEGAEVRVVTPNTGEQGDPLLAIDDALREFPADEIVVVTQPEEDTTWLERGTSNEATVRFGIPVTHLVVS